MSNKRGKTNNLTFAWQKIDRAISGLNGECFTPKEIHEVTGLNNAVSGPFLCEKTRKGLLERVGHGCYKKVSNGSLSNRLPAAFVATKVWDILLQSDKPLAHRDISEIIEKETGFNTYFSIGVLLFIWYRKKALDKIGGKKPYEYQIKPDYKNKNRPVSSLLT